MPRKQVYGKRTQLYSNFAAFGSPVKSRKQPEVIDVAEIAEELEKLTVRPNPEKGETKDEGRVRRPLFERDGNATIKSAKPSGRGKRTKKQPKEQEDIILLAEHRLETPIETAEPVHNIPQEETCKKSTATVLEVDEPALLPEQSQETIPVQPTLPPVSNIYTKHTSSLLSLSSHPLTSFTTWSEQLSSHFAITKIAEASYGEVYRLALLSSDSALTKADESVLKIIALKPPPAAKKKMSKAAKKRTEMMSSSEDVASEVRLMQQMTCIPGFTNFREVCILQGRPGDSFISAWSNWNDSQKAKGKESSVFPDPRKKGSYTEEQLWAVIEMQDAGTDLENIKVKDVWLAWDVFWGVVLALGKGEEAVRFEHRDLHMGNICISGLNPDHGSEALIVANKKLGYTGIETTLIDYTISRAEMGTSEGEEDVAFLDLERDPILFEGDAEEEYQYEMYRHMRAAMYLDDPLADIYERWDEATDTGRTWRGYHPQTNLVWLHFILHELLKQFNWRDLDAQLSTHASDAARIRAMQLVVAFTKLQQLLDPQELPSSGLRSASNLVGLALDEGWLDKEDVQGRTFAPSAGKTPRRRQKRSRTKKAPKA